MSYIVGISDNITQYSSTTALSAVDASTLANGTLASVNGGPMFYFVKNSNRTANGTTILRAFNSAGRWIEYFLQTGQTTDNTSYGTPFVVGVTARSTTPISYVFNTSTSGTLYLKAKATFSAGTCTAFGALTMVRYR